MRLAAVATIAALATLHASPAPRLLVVSARANGEIARAYDGGRVVATPPLPKGSGLTAVWSRDGTQVAWGDARGVWVEHADGSGRRRVLAVRSVCSTPCTGGPTLAWAPDGSRLAAGGVDPRTTGMVSVELQTGRVTRLVRPRRFAFQVPIAFSPDGTKLSYAYYSGNAGTSSCCKSQLRVVNADGSHVRILFNFRDAIHDGPGDATWSPSGSRIAFTDDGRDPRDPRFAIVDVETGKVHPLAGRQVYDQAPAWSPDGNRLAMTQYGAPAFTVRTDGTGFRRLPVAGSLALWRHDGDLLVASGRKVVSLRDGRAPVTILRLPKGEDLLSLAEAL